MTSLISAVKGGDVYTVKKLLMADKVDVNAQDRDGNTALHHLIFAGCYDFLVNLFLKKGADVTIKNNDGVSPEDLVKDFSAFEDEKETA